MQVGVILGCIMAKLLPKREYHSEQNKMLRPTFAIHADLHALCRVVSVSYLPAQMSLHVCVELCHIAA